MIEFLKIPIGEIEKYVEIAFAGDNELVEQFHFMDKTLAGTIINNVSNIEMLNEKYPINCYSLNIDGVPIGFTVGKDHLLYSFGINKAFRTKEIVLSWWYELLTVLAPNFVCCLYPENTRAINFFMRNGMEIFEQQKNSISLIYKSE
jgi:ribosomal protein S18 acetylase RimI-like enzyme